MRPLENIYAGPLDLLEKARRDRDALRAAAAAPNDLILRDKLFDFSVTAYHIIDWVKAFHPDLTSAAYGVLDVTPALGACRDLANGSKHFKLALDREPYRSHPRKVDEVDFSAVPQVSAELHTNPIARRLKVVLLDGQRIRIEDLADKAVSAWEKFFADHGLAP